MLKETYTVVEDAKCAKCGEVTECFQHYEWNHETDMPQIWVTECGYCDMDTDPRGAEAAEDLQNPEMWPEVFKKRETIMPKKDKLDWMKLVDNPPAEANIDWSSVEVYATPDWVRHPERYPEIMKRMEELGEKYRELLSGKKEGSKK